MLDEQLATSVRDRLDREAARSNYPDGFPAMPPMPAARYVDPQFHELEMAHLWRKTWLYAVHASELPEAGSYKLFERLGLSIIISRGRDGEIRAFHNICRHRASPLLSERCGKARRFTCPYHAWTYNEHGALIGVPEAHNFGNLERSQRGLLSVRCESWRGLVYINLDEGAAPLEQFIGPIHRQIAATYPLEELCVKGHAEVEIPCNWKIAYDNFLEAYHVPTIHATSIMPWLAPETFAIDLLPHGHLRYTVRRTVPLRAAKPGSPNLPGVGTVHLENTLGLVIFPNMIGATDPGGFPWVTFWPVGPGKVLMDVQLVGWKGDQSSYWDDLLATILKIFDEDVALLGNIQCALESGVVPDMAVGYVERIIPWYHEEIDRVIGEERIPAHCRMDQVLAGCVVNEA